MSRLRAARRRLIPALALGLLLAIPACTGGSGPQAASPPRSTTPPSITPSPSPPPSPPSPPPPPRYHVTVGGLDPATRARMLATGSWRPGCPVPLDALRLLTLTYWGFDGRPHTGRLVVHRDAVHAVATAMHSLFRIRFPIRQMRLVDAYGASDDRSMAADNTSAFNCRLVEGTDVWSQHALGRAIDINPRENPQIAGGVVSPPNGRPYVNRSHVRLGMIPAGGAVVRAFAAVGWKWGGYWHSLKDYQHFSANGL